MADVDALMRKAPVIPVLVIDRLEDAAPIAEAPMTSSQTRVQRAQKIQ